MTRTLVGLAVLSASSLMPVGCNATGTSGSVASANASPRIVNSYCPIGREPIVETVSTATHKGATIGFCCPGCEAMWPTMSDAEKDEFVALALAGNEPGVGG